MFDEFGPRGAEDEREGFWTDLSEVPDEHYRDEDEPKQTQEVRIPTDPSDVIERYNDLQLAQGFDLHDYAGKTVRRYVYEIENYPGGDGQYYATLLICKGAVIGGDVCAAEKGGVMHGFAMPEAAKTAA